MTKKKIVSLCLAAMLVVMAIAGATVAYFTDTDNETNTFDMCIIVQTQTHIFRNDWELELDGLEPLAIRLPFLIDLDFG